MQDGSEYANPKYLDQWNKNDWTVWFWRNEKIFKYLGLDYDVNIAITKEQMKND